MRVALVALLGLSLVGAESKARPEIAAAATSHLPDWNNPVRSAAQDEIRSLPGLSEGAAKFRQFSGFLDTSLPTTTEPVAQFTHYWFVERQEKPADAPLLVWLSGGPGGSSLHALLLENGPFEVAPDGETLKLRNSTWNKLANVLYLESPYSVGYSYSTVAMDVHSDYGTEHEQLRALQSFFAKFPAYARSPLYLFGQGYGASYITLMAYMNFYRPALANLKGLAIGDGLLQDNLLAKGAAFFLRDNKLVNSTTWARISKLCCQPGKEPTAESCEMKGVEATVECENFMSSIVADLKAAGVNPHNIHDRCSLLRAEHERSSPLAAFKEPPGCDTLGPLTSYMNRPDVRAALHIPARLGTWAIFRDLNYRHEGATFESGIFPWQMQELANSVPVLMYNGNLDMTCNALGNEWFADSLHLGLVEDTKPWEVSGRVAGTIKRFKGLTFVRVNEAGKDVPRDAPEAAFELAKAFLDGNL